MTETLNSLSASWWSWIAPVSLQVAILGGLAWLVDLALRKRGWAQVRYALWLVVFARLVIPPGFSLPTSLTAGLVDVPAQAVETPRPTSVHPTALVEDVLASPAAMEYTASDAEHSDDATIEV